MSENQDPEDYLFSVQDRRKRGYFTIDNVLLDTYGLVLGPHGIAVYAALSYFANKEQECWPSFRTITARTGVSRSQIVREIAKMEKLQIISVTRRINEKKQRTSHLYTLLDIVGVVPHRYQGGGTTQVPPSTRQVPKQSLKNKDTHNGMNKDKDYRPPADIDPLTR